MVLPPVGNCILPVYPGGQEHEELVDQDHTITPEVRGVIQDIRVEKHPIP